MWVCDLQIIALFLFTFLTVCQLVFFVCKIFANATEIQAALSLFAFKARQSGNSRQKLKVTTPKARDTR